MTAFQTLRALAAGAALALAFSSPVQASGGSVSLETFPTSKLTDQAALQNGAKTFMNYCLGCHGLSQVRYNRLRDLGLTEEQIKQNLILTNAKFGDPIMTTMPRQGSSAWFGKTPPDLSLTARSRASGDGSGPDWIYSYLKAYYVDEARPTGWNNTVYPNVGMPNVLWTIQGKNEPVYKEVTNHGHTEVVLDRLKQVEPGTMSPADFDNTVADLTAFLTWAADPSAQTRKQVGVWVLFFLGLFFVFAWRLNASYWKDIR